MTIKPIVKIAAITTITEVVGSLVVKAVACQAKNSGLIYPDGYNAWNHF